MAVGVVSERVARQYMGYRKIAPIMAEEYMGDPRVEAAVHPCTHEGHTGVKVIR